MCPRAASTANAIAQYPQLTESVCPTGLKRLTGMAPRLSAYSYKTGLELHTRREETNQVELPQLLHQPGVSLLLPQAIEQVNPPIRGHGGNPVVLGVVNLNQSFSSR